MVGVVDGRHTASRAVLEVLALTLLAFAVAFLAGVAFIVPLVVLGYDVAHTFALVGATAAGQVGMLLAALGYRRYRPVTVPLSLPSWRDLGIGVLGLVVAMVVAIGLAAILAALDLLPDSIIGDVAATDPTYLLGLAALSVVVVAPVEEFVFRGVIQGRLREHVGPAPAIVGASLLFGSLHLANYSGRPLPIVSGGLLIAAVGAVFGAVYVRTDTLVVPIAVHAAYNVVLLGVSYLALSSGEDPRPRFGAVRRSASRTHPLGSTGVPDESSSWG